MRSSTPSPRRSQRRSRAFLLFVLLLILSLKYEVGFCQETYFSDYPVWSSESAITRSVAVGDVNGDGYLDLVCGNYGKSTTLYLNDGGALQADPAWSAGALEKTNCVALGDVDGDGDLDLVCGSNGQSVLYLNDDGTLQVEPAWSSGSADTRSVALGDMDGDGDLDLVCGNYGQSTLYRNDGGTLQSDPLWMSDSTYATSSVALGDIDGDSDLDLVCGNFLESTTLYLNDGGLLQTAPAWSSDSTGATSSVALGDIDGDGDLDLVCGNTGQSTTLFLNDGGVLQTLPAWSGGQTNQTTGVALGDIDGDGDIDLVCGDQSNGALLHIAQGDTLQTTPVWSSGVTSKTQSVALADLDADGDLDLICGNSGQTTVYRNGAGPLPTSPAWSILTSPRGVALGDVDRDGDLDVVCGNYNQGSTLYLNNGGTLQTSPGWSSSLQPNAKTTSVALGDVDGDGYPDLICGNEGISRLYLGDGTTFQPDSSWSSQMASTSCVSFADIDGDGDLDLLCGAASNTPQTRLYLNDEGILQRSPVWQPDNWGDWNEPTNGIAAGDADGDGDLDVVCGNLISHSSSAAGAKLYLNERGALQVNPIWSSGQRSNSSSVALGDVDGDSYPDLVCCIAGESTILYHNLGGTFQAYPNWSSGPMDLTYAVALGDIDGDGDLDLVCGNAGQPSTLYRNDGGTLQTAPAWSSDPTPSGARSVALGDIEGDGDLDIVAGNQLYTGKAAPAYKGDPLSPTRQLANNGAHLRFVRAKQTAPESWRVRFNARDVESDRIWLVPEYRYKGTSTWSPVVVAGQTGKVGPFATSPAGVADSIEWDTHLLPFDARDVVLRLRVIEIPKRVSVIQHVAPYLHEVGPVTPYRPVISTAETLSFPAVTLGDSTFAEVNVINRGSAELAITSVVLPTLDMHLDETLPIHIAPKGSAILTISLTPSVDVDVEGRLVIGSDDPFSPSTVVAVTADVRPLDFTLVNSYPTSEIAQDTPLGVSIVMQDYVHVDSARVFFREGGRTDFGALRLQRLDDPVNEQYYGSVPASSISARGIEYFVEVYNERFSRSAELRRLRTRVKNLEFTAVPPAKQYGMISVPLFLESPIAGLITDDLGDMDPTKWRIWGYDGSESVYVEVPNETITHFEVGRGYWLITRDAPPIDTAPAEGLSTQTEGPYSLVLSPGWNMIGDPFDFAVSWDSVLVNGQTMEEAESVLVEPPVEWVVGQGYEHDRRVLEPFVGYWVKNRMDTDVTLEIPPREAVVPVPAVASKDQDPSPSTADEWQVTIRAKTSETTADATVVGVSPLGSAGWDRLDRSEPPMSPGSSLSLYVVRGSERLARDIREVESPSSTSGGEVWRLDIAKSFSTSPVGDQVRIEVEGLDQIPEDAKVYLVDRTLDQLTDLRVTQVYECFVGVRDVISDEGKARFALLVGSDEFVTEHQQDLPSVPTETVLHQNHPNPFNPTTIIRYELAKAGMVRLRIYDARGALVKDLYKGHRPAGRYEVGWDGANERGERVASGVYFYVLETPEVKQTKKMVCLK
jgi:hypothetical protein